MATIHFSSASINACVLVVQDVVASFCYIKDTGSTNTSPNFGPIVSTTTRSPAAKQCVIDRPVWFVHDLRTNQMASIDRENPQ